MQPKKTTTSMAQATAGTTTTRKNARPPWGHYGIGWLTVRPRWQGLRLPCHRFHKVLTKVTGGSQAAIRKLAKNVPMQWLSEDCVLMPVHLVAKAAVVSQTIQCRRGTHV